MILFLYGEDTYRMKEKMKEIIEKYKKVHKSGLNLKYFDNFEDLKDGMKQMSMFKEKKLAIINNPFSNIEFKEKFSENGKDFAKSEDIIVFYQEEVNKNDTFFKFLKKNAKCQEFSSLGGLKLKEWIRKEFGKYQTEIEPKSLEMLIEYIGNDLWRMSNEIKKLVSYKEKVSSEDVKLLIRPKIETAIFKTIDAISQKNKKLAINLIHKHIEKGDHPLYLLSMINYQFRNLLIIKDLVEKHKPYSVILKKSGLHPFVVRKSYYQAQKFSFQELKKIYQKIFQVDFDIKTGRIKPEIALDLLIAEI